MEIEKIRQRKCNSRAGMQNEMQLTFDAVSENEAFARIAVSAFVMPLNPTIEELADIKTAVSEAVTNAIIHGYDAEEKCDGEEKKDGAPEEKVLVKCTIVGDVLHVEVTDEGKGIENVSKAMEPLFTTKPDMDRSGMGFSFMEAFMDDLEVISEPGMGTSIFMKKKLGTSSWILKEE